MAAAGNLHVDREMEAILYFTEVGKGKKRRGGGQGAWLASD